MSGYQINVEEKAALEDIQVLRRNLTEFNFARTGQRGQAISVFLRDDKASVVGGAHVWTAFGWLHIDLLWLKEDIRRKGLGSQLLEASEAEDDPPATGHARSI